MQQCLVIMHDDAHDQVLVAFNIGDVTVHVFAMLQHIIFDVAIHVFRYCTTYFL
jgi:hypothetical protein